jgi:hypothetical protein
LPDADDPLPGVDDRMPTDAPYVGRATRSHALAWALLEAALIFGLFYVYAGTAVPDRNESHYLAKARHYWDPSWCPGDQFLESADAHLVFYWTFGWITLLFPLPAVAWIGRIGTWALLAITWQRLSYTLVPRRMASLLSAAMFVCLLHLCHMAGEWVIGGVEAKGFAFVLVFAALEAMVRGRWRWVWPLLGVATSFHVLVGGWALMAAGIAWLMAPGERPGLLRSLPWMAAGVLLALPGLVPALLLTVGAPSEIVREANDIYVFQRLPHHLVPTIIFETTPSFAVRHVVLVVVWGGLFLAVARDPAQWQFARFVAGSVLIAVIGVSIALLTQDLPTIAAALLRFYWFRMSDVMVPLGVAMLALAMWQQLSEWRPAVGRWTAIALAAVTAMVLAGIVNRERNDLRPKADRQSLPVSRYEPELTWAIYEDWRRACNWIEANTEPDARFLTPRMQQTFKWYASRGEVATWKDIPQDAQSIVEWWERFHELYPQFVDDDGYWNQGLAAHDDAELCRLAHKYGAQYVVIDRTVSRRRPQFERVYPTDAAPNGSYAVYRVPAECGESSR